MNISNKVKFIFKFLFLLHLLVVPSILYAQNQEIELKQISEGNGLPGVSARCLFQDHAGIIWVGIEEVGLCMYEGNNFLLFTTINGDPTSLTNLMIEDIIEDQNFNLWIATQNGLFRYNRNKRNFTSFLPNKQNNLPDTKITTLANHNSDEIWVGTNNGFCLYSISTNTAKQYLTSLSSKHRKISVRKIFEDSKQRVWILTNEFLYLLDLKTNKIKEINPNTETSENKQDDITAVYEDYEHSLWFASRKVLLKLNETTKQFEKKLIYSSEITTQTDANYVYEIIRDKRGWLWLATANNGLMAFQPQTNQYFYYHTSLEHKNGLKSDALRDVIEDKNGLIWLATKFEGIQIFNPKSSIFKVWKKKSDKNDGLSDIFILSTFQDSKQNIWLGTRKGGLNLYNPTTNSFTNYFKNNGIPAERIMAIDETINGNILLGTQPGLFLFDYKTKKSRLFPCPPVFSIFCRQSDTAWIGTQKGLYYFVKNKLIKYNDNSNILTDKYEYIKTLYKDRHKNLFIGTFNDGLFVLNIKADKMRMFQNNPQNKKTISNNAIRTIYEDSNGKYWIGTKGGGLNLFNLKNGDCKIFDEQNRFPSNSVFSIAEDKNGYLWLGTFKGLTKFNTNNLTYENYTKEYGLQSDVAEPNGMYLLQSGDILYGGDGGFNIFNPNQIQKIIQVSPLIINSVKIYDKTLSVDIDSSKIFHLKHNQNYISIDFTLLDFEAPLHTKYSYKMEGVDGDWIFSKNRHFASYTNLEPGTYKFIVKAETKEGIKIENDLSLTFIIKPPFWKTWWFRILAIVFILSSIYAFYRIKINRLNRQKQILEEKVKERTCDLELANNELHLQKEEITQQNEEILQQAEELQSQADLLAEQNKKLRELDKFKESMTGAIVHDLKNPLNSIIVLSELMLPYQENSDDLMNLKMMNQSGKLMLQLVMNILEVQKFESAKMKIEKQPVLLKNIITNTLEQVPLLLEQKAIKTNINIPENIKINGDGEMLVRVFTNLLTNAIKFTPNEGSIFIETKKCEKPDFVLIIVKDTGIGIRTEKLSSIFEKFNQAEARNLGQTKSTGLGLAFCKMAVEAHSGKIWAESEVGLGTSFFISLPILENSD